MAFGVAFWVGTAAFVAATALESEAQATKAKTIRGIRRGEAEDITKKNIEAGEQTQATADRFKGAERTALTELQDRRNIESLKEVEEDVREGTDPTDTGFAGTSQTFATEREARQAEDAEKAEADRLASARFLSPGQSALAEKQFIQDLGIENQSLALDARGIQQVANAKVAGVGLKNQGLITMLKIISYAASAYSLATAAAGTAVTKAGEEAYKKAAEKAVEEAAKKGAVSATTKATLKSTFEAAGYSSMYAHPLFEGAKWAEIGASSLPGATNALTNQAAQLANTPLTGQEAFKAGLANSPDPFLQTLYTPAEVSQVGGSAVPGFAPTNFAEVGAHVSPAYARGSLADQALAKKLAGTGEFLQLGTKSAVPFDNPELLELLEQFELRGARTEIPKKIYPKAMLDTYPKPKIIQQYR
jgi:hypothetical protein